MKVSIAFLFLFFCITVCYSQSKIESDIEPALQNAKKGVYWALSNLPKKKTRIENDLIADDKLYSTVVVTKEVNGFKIVSNGFNNSNEVTITIYKSFERLKEEGFLSEESTAQTEKGK